jgi:hypothetical protein
VSHRVQRISFPTVICLYPTLIPSAHAGFFDKANGLLDTLQKDTQGSTHSSLSGAMSSIYIINGLREAL